MFSSHRGNAWVEHRPRPVGKSNYNWFRILALVMRILFNYSAYPLRLVSLLGFAVSILAFIAGIYYLIRALFIGTSVPGWASVIVLLSFFSGINTIIVSMLGEYLIRLVRQTSESSSYHLKEILNYHD
jgi:hypothetical protein